MYMAFSIGNYVPKEGCFVHASDKATLEDATYSHSL